MPALAPYTSNTHQGRRQRGGQWYPSRPPFKICVLHFMFGPRFLRTSNLYLKMWPTLWFWPPCCEILATVLTPTRAPPTLFLSQTRACHKTNKNSYRLNTSPTSSKIKQPIYFSLATKPKLFHTSDLRSQQI